MHYVKVFWNSFINSFLLFKKHDTLTLGAALSYYTGFSLIPIVILVMLLAGSVLGPQAVQGMLYAQLSELIGSQNASQLETIIKAVYKPSGNTFTTVLAIVLVLIGATSVFSQLHTSLNTIWDVKNKARQPILDFFITRLFSLAMIVCLSFLLLISFVVHSGLTMVTNKIGLTLPWLSITLLNVFDFILSYAVTALLFALVYKYLSDAQLKWKSIWPGALFTALLFVVGKHLMAIYFGKFSITDTYGAAGSVVVLLTWVFYSSQIVFFGAEFTHAFAAEHGKLLDENNIRHTADTGIKHPH